MFIAAARLVRYNGMEGDFMDNKDLSTANGNRDQAARDELAKLEKKGWHKLTLREKTALAALRAYFAHQSGLDQMQFLKP